MKTKKSIVLFLVSCLALTLTLCLGVAAEDGAAKETFIDRMGMFNFVSLIVFAVVLVVAAVLCIVKREKVLEGLRAYKSEMKKITWFPWKSVWRSTILVLVVVLITALLVGVQQGDVASTAGCCPVDGEVELSSRRCSGEELTEVCHGDSNVALVTACNGCCCRGCCGCSNLLLDCGSGSLLAAACLLLSGSVSFLVSLE